MKTRILLLCILTAVMGDSITHFGTPLLDRELSHQSKHPALYILFPQPITGRGHIYAVSGIFASTSPVYIGVWRAASGYGGRYKTFRLLQQWEVSATETGNCVYSQLLSPCYGVEVGDYIGVYSRETPWAVSSYDQSQSYSTYVYKGGNELRQTGQGPSKGDERIFELENMTSSISISLSLDETGICLDDIVACLTDQLPHCPPSAGRLDTPQCFYVDSASPTPPTPTPPLPALSPVSINTTPASNGHNDSTSTAPTSTPSISEAHVHIEGYIEPLQEGSKMLLFCTTHNPYLQGVRYEWVFTPEGTNYVVPLGYSQELTRPSVGRRDAGEYTCRARLGTLDVDDRITVEVLTDGAGAGLVHEERLAEDAGANNTIILTVVVLVALVVYVLAAVVVVAIRIRRRRDREGNSEIEVLDEIGELEETDDPDSNNSLDVEDIES